MGVKFSDLFGRAKIVEYFLMHEGISQCRRDNIRMLLKIIKGIGGKS